MQHLLEGLPQQAAVMPLEIPRLPLTAVTSFGALVALCTGWVLLLRTLWNAPTNSAGALLHMRKRIATCLSAEEAPARGSSSESCAAQLREKGGDPELRVHVSSLLGMGCGSAVFQGSWAGVPVAVSVSRHVRGGLGTPASRMHAGQLLVHPNLARVFAYRTERVVGDPGTFVSGCLHAAGKGPHPEPNSRPAISFPAALTLSGAAPPGVGLGSAEGGSEAPALNLAQPAGALYETVAVIELYDRGSLRDLLRARLHSTNHAPPSQESARQSVLPCINPSIPASLVPAPLRLPHLARSGWLERPGAGGAACACGSSDPDPTEKPCQDATQLTGWSPLSSMGQGMATIGAAIQSKSGLPLGAGLCAAMGLKTTPDWPGWAAIAGAHLPLMPALCPGPSETAQVDGQQARGWGEGLWPLSGLELGSGLGGGMRKGSLWSAACGEPSCDSNSGTDVTSDAPSVSVAASAASRDMWSFSADCTVAAGAPADRAVPLMIKGSPEGMSGCVGDSASDGERSMFASAGLCCAAGDPNPDANPKTKPNPFAAAASASFGCVCAVRPGTAGAAAAAKGSGLNSGLGPGSESARLSSEAGPDGAGLVALLGDAAAAQELALDLLTLLEVGHALAHLHAGGVAHGRVCAANVQLRSCGHDRRGFSSLLGCPDGEASTVPRAEKLSPAADVHAFGVLMLEVVTRQCSADRWDSLPAEPCAVCVPAKALAARGPPRLPAYAALVRECVRCDAQQRPSMADVVACLGMIQRALLRATALEDIDALFPKTCGPRAPPPPPTAPRDALLPNSTLRDVRLAPHSIVSEPGTETVLVTWRLCPGIH